MSINNQTSLGFKDLIQILLQTQMDYKWFSVRKKLNYEKALFLPISKEFTKDILSIKEEFNVPKLSPDKDYIFIEGAGIEIEDSNWLSVKPKEFINRWEACITELLHKYKLPVSFIDWVEWNILYGKPKTYPNYNMETFLEIIRYPQEANRIGLTTGEKKLMLELLRFVIKSTKGKRRTTLKKSFVQLEEIIKQSKNRRRGIRSLKTSLIAYNKPEVETYHDTTKGSHGEDVTKHYSYRKLVSDHFDIDTEDDNEFEEEINKNAAKLRKQKERLLKRHIQPQKVEN
ncbi:hypothetical protein HY383_02150 [Candidatus Daviesbacteria bacterium]|nr:hypothetical protein [Candidatus Daviesbacteria bacterium]